jgi:hypothetical protein
LELSEKVVQRLHGWVSRREGARRKKRREGRGLE